MASSSSIFATGTRAAGGARCCISRFFRGSRAPCPGPGSFLRLARVEIHFQRVRHGFRLVGPIGDLWFRPAFCCFVSAGGVGEAAQRRLALRLTLVRLYSGLRRLAYS